MLLRRLSDHIRAQNWTAIALDFVIVVSGVFIAMQVANWNEARASRDGAINALHRLHAEIDLNIVELTELITRIDETADVRAAAITALDQCDASPAAEAAMSEAVTLLTSDIVPTFISNTLSELARQDDYLRLYSEDFRVALNTYDGHLIDETGQLKINFGLLWDQHIINHPFVDFDISPEDINASTITFSQPVEVLCRDSGFRRRFMMSEIWHGSAKLRLIRFKERSNTFILALEAELERLE